MRSPRRSTALGSQEAAGVFAVVASAGATNAGTIDELDGVADACAARDLWFHVDGAYGGAGLVAPSVRERYRRYRARRLLHRRSPQVAVRALRLLRSGLSRPDDGPRRLPARSELPRHRESAGRNLERVESGRLRLPPVAPSPRAPLVVLTRDLWHRRLPGSRGTRADAHQRRRPRRSVFTTSSSS